MDIRRIAHHSRTVILVMLAGVCFAAVADWRQVTNVPPWAPRIDEGAVVFQNKIWVLGGATRSEIPPGTLFNDVWYSSDGAHWTLATAHADWSPRRVHLCLAFHDKLWLFGSNELWYSGDGVRWTQVTDTPPGLLSWKRPGLVFDDKIWVLGGATHDAMYPCCLFNDVWCSSDGLNWTEVTPAAPWAARTDHSCVVHDGKMWVIAGWTVVFEDTEYLRDAWCSSDGINWTQTIAYAPWNWNGTSAVAYGGKIWLLQNNGIRPWYTEDGVTWLQGPNTVPWSDLRDSVHAVTYAGEMWAITGTSTGDYTSQYNTVWHSSDGETWIGSDGPARFGPRSWHASTVFDDKLWVLGGRCRVTSGSLGDVWSSPNGADWTQATAMASWGPRTGHTSLAFNGRIWVMGGSGGSGNDVWYSSDGAQWTTATAAAPWSPRRGHASAVHNGKIWVVGGYYYDGINYCLADVWRSTDGLAWAEATGAAAWGPRAFHACVSYDGKIWLTGGLLQVYGSITSFNDVWYSSDGANWTQATQSAPWTPRYGHALAVHDGQMWLLGGARWEHTSDGTSLQFFNDAWYSTDGVNWTEADEAPDWKPRSAHTAASFDGKLWLIGGYEGSSYELVLKDIWCAEDPRAFAFTKAPAADWKEEGGSLTLDVAVQGAAGDVTYQWVKDGEALEGETSSVLTVPSLQLTDEGYYWCVVTDESEGKAVHESPHAYVQVFPAGSLPVTRTLLTIAVAAMAVAASLALYAFRTRQRKQQATPLE
jgi:N-acetylneuraminic acid mutarotase